MHVVTVLRWTRSLLTNPLFGALSCCIACALPAPGARAAPTDFTGLSLEELSSLKMSLAMRHTEPVFGTAAAVSVLLGDEIQRFGGDSVASGLRLVPGVWVANTNTDRWSVGIRGFNGLSSTKLLVLVDGRNIYSPYYGGVDWAEADVAIEDLDRVEVVRGPGGTLWGANAVNGVINVVSKSAQDTQGALVRAREGTDEGLDTYLRYGGAMGPHTWYRVYWRTTNTEDRATAARPAPNEEFQQYRGGVRVDFEADASFHATWQAETARQEHETTTRDAATGQIFQAKTIHNFANTIGRIKWRSSGGDLVTAQVFADYADDSANRGSYQGFAGGPLSVAQDGHNFDIDVAHELKRGIHEVVWGADARSTLIDVDSDGVLQLQRPRLNQSLYSLFAQDEIDVSGDDRVRFSFGSKFEHRDTIGWQVMPSVRCSVQISPNQTWWAAISRAVRAPSESERDTRIPFAATPPTATMPATLTNIVSNSNFHEESVVAYETGWRWKPTTELTLDASAYVNDYRELRNLNPVTVTPFDPVTHLPLQTPVVTELRLINQTSATGYGVEVTSEWRPNALWRLTANYTFERIHPRGTIFADLTGFDYAMPTQLASVRSWWELTRNLEFSTGAYYTAGVTAFGVPANTRSDAQLTWHPRPDLEFDLGVQNAADPKHPEYSPISVTPTAEVRRNVFVRGQWRF